MAGAAHRDVVPAGHGTTARAALAESIGTFALVFIGCGAIVVDAQTGVLGPVGVAITFGLVILVMVAAVGHVSGAHFNPAVTLAFLVSRRIPRSRAVAHWVAQLVAAVVAAASVGRLVGRDVHLGATLPQVDLGSAFAIEVVLAFTLVFVTMAVATDPRAPRDGAAIAVGATIAANSLFAGPLTGAGMNPARSLGPALASGTFEHLWIYLTAPLVGALIGAAAYGVLRAPEPRQ